MTSHFFDIGANVGQTFKDYLNPSTEFDGWAVWCFEPSPRHIPELMAEAKKQSERYRVRVCPYGVRGSNEVRAFFQKDDPRGDSFESYMASDHEPINLKEGYELMVPSVGIVDAILQGTAEGDRIILKIDAEGSEYNIMTHLFKSDEALARVSEILIEWHRINLGEGDMTTEQINRRCEEKGITIRKWGF